MRLFELAKEQNILAVLDTGTGKTLIAVMLLKHMRDLDAGRKSKRISIFLVPTVTLVTQQSSYIQQTTDLEVLHFHGHLGVAQKVEEARWRDFVQKYDCFVMTPAILEQILRRAYIAMSEINLLVFDECHHARKNSMYNQIMSIFYVKCPQEKRPKVFGMTASPSCKGKSASEALRQLECNLFSTAFTADNLVDFEKFINRPAEEVIFFKGSQPDLNTFDFTEKLICDHPLVRKMILDGRAVAIDLGSWCRDYFLACCLIFLSKYVDSITDSLESNVRNVRTPSDEDQAMGTNFELPGMGIDDESESLMKESEENIASLKWVITVLSKQGLPDLSQKGNNPSLGELSLKLQTLVAVLKQYEASADSFCGIIFVERRAQAKLIKHVLSELHELKFLNIGLLVGHGVGTRLSDGSMKIKEQKKTLAEFRKGQINLLIATSAAEEGLDVQPCMLVIRFDMAKNVIQNIQSRGRARHANARYIQLVREDDEAALQALYDLQAREAEMRGELLREKVQDEGEDMMTDIDEDVHEEYVIPATGARLTTPAAIQFLHDYCSRLPSDPYTYPMPDFKLSLILMESGSEGFGYICSITLPMNAPKKARLVTGFAKVTKAGARRSAAFQAVKRLHAIGELDDRLRPVRVGKVFQPLDEGEESIIEAGIENVAFDELSINQYDIGVPLAFRCGWDQKMAWLVLIELKDEFNVDRVLDFGMLVPSPLYHEIRDICKIVLDNAPRTLKLHVSKEPVPIEDHKENIAKYGAALWSSLLRKARYISQTSLIYFAVPLQNGGEEALVSMLNGTLPEELIDWHSILATSLSLWTGNAHRAPKVTYDIPNLFRNVGEELVVCDRWYYERKYKVFSVEHDKRPHTTPCAGFKSVSDFYKYRLKATEQILEDQPLLLASSLPHIFQAGKSQDSMAASFVYLIPQFCTPFPIPATIVIRSALYLPMIIRSMHHAMLAIDLRASLKLEALISPILMVQALTASGAMAAGDYERLEFLGDSFLKAHISVHLFCHYPTKNEGWLTKTRRVLERNSNLKDISVKFSFPEAMLVDPLTRKGWMPPDFKTPGSHGISNKAVADTVEAVIGGCYVHSGVIGAGTAVKNLLNLDVFDPVWANYLTIFRKNAGKSFERTVVDSMDEQGVQAQIRIRISQKIEGLFGYKFKDPFTLLEALTHASALQEGASSCYQRLEFLGDAILGFVVASFLFHRNKAADPGTLSDLKTELVNNQFLGVAGFHMGLHKLLIHMNSSLASSITDFARRLEDIMKGDDDDVPSVPDGCFNRKRKGYSEGGEGREPIPLFWLGMPAVPKVVPDAFEAILGAIFMDSECDLAVLEEVINKVLIHPWWPHFEAAGADQIGWINGRKHQGRMISNPVKEMHEAAAKSKCKQIIIKCDQEPTTQKQVCVVTKHGVEIGTGTDASKKSAKREAAKKALPFLEKFAATGDPLCDCDTQRRPCLSNMEKEAAREDEIDKEVDRVQRLVSAHITGSNKKESSVQGIWKSIIMAADGMEGVGHMDVEIDPGVGKSPKGIARVASDIEMGIDRDTSLSATDHIKPEDAPMPMADKDTVPTEGVCIDTTNETTEPLEADLPLLFPPPQPYQFNPNDYDITELLMEIAAMEVHALPRGTMIPGPSLEDTDEVERAAQDGMLVEDGMWVPVRKRRMVVLGVTEWPSQRPRPMVTSSVVSSVRVSFDPIGGRRTWSEPPASLGIREELEGELISSAPSSPWNAAGMAKAMPKSSFAAHSTASRNLLAMAGGVGMPSNLMASSSSVPSVVSVKTTDVDMTIDMPPPNHVVNPTILGVPPENLNWPLKTVSLSAGGGVWIQSPFMAPNIALAMSEIGTSSLASLSSSSLNLIAMARGITLQSDSISSNTTGMTSFNGGSRVFEMAGERSRVIHLDTSASRPPPTAVLSLDSDDVGMTVDVAGWGDEFPVDLSAASDPALVQPLKPPTPSPALTDVMPSFAASSVSMNLIALARGFQTGSGSFK
ncbi:Dicer-like protein 1 [Dinochytrium kinnereticum]|nr:Dicer-like protein 1 [Dinochytrium kinnereticum]